MSLPIAKHDADQLVAMQYIKGTNGPHQTEILIRMCRT